MAGFNLMRGLRSIGKRRISTADLSDFSTTAPAEGEVPVFDETTGTYVPGEVGGAVDSVNTQTGAVVLDADDIDDAATTNKFTTAADIAKLAAIEAGAQVNDVTSVNGDAGAVVLAADDFIAAGAATGSNPDGGTWTATATVVKLQAGGALEDEYTFAAPAAPSNGGHVATIINRCGAAATIKGVVGGDITLADDRALIIVVENSEWIRLDYSA